jgi:aspartate-semialdehyde dehydrogenase
MVEQQIPVAVLGATGMVGQRFISLLEHHPWFKVVALTGSERRAGLRYGDAVSWRLPSPPPADVMDLPVLPPDGAFDASIAFSALPTDEANTIEPLMAARGHAVFSNASSYRMAEDVPLLIPEINAHHLGILEHQRRARGWQQGLLVTNPNCSTIQVALALKPLYDAFGIKRVQVTTLQAISGAGYPGVASYDIVANVIPYIGSEEEKIERETRKILGGYANDAMTPAEIVVSAQCTRVPVVEGHLACVSVELGREASSADLVDVFHHFSAEPQEYHLPTAPQPAIIVRDEPDRPQPRRDVDAGNGMAIVVGRVRPCALLGHKFIVLGHNTIRGAAGASILNAELMIAKGLIAKG